jgi:hypothetical protein
VGRAHPPSNDQQVLVLFLLGIPCDTLQRPGRLLPAASANIDWSPRDSETEVNVESAMEDVVESIEDL